MKLPFIGRIVIHFADGGSPDREAEERRWCYRSRWCVPWWPNHRYARACPRCYRMSSHFGLAVETRVRRFKEGRLSFNFHLKREFIFVIGSKNITRLWTPKVFFICYELLWMAEALLALIGWSSIRCDRWLVCSSGCALLFRFLIALLAVGDMRHCIYKPRSHCSWMPWKSVVIPQLIFLKMFWGWVFQSNKSEAKLKVYLKLFNF